MFSTVVCCLAGFVGVVFGDSANEHIKKNQEVQVQAVVKRESAAWGADE